MIEITAANAQPPHDGRRFANSQILIEAAPRATRISLRVSPNSAAKLTRPLGVKLPLSAKTSATKEGRSALWLGPDEWLVFDENPATAGKIVEKLARHDCSMVDISHRNTAIIVSGKGIEDLLATGCPQDLSLRSFSVGACSRTIFGKIEIVLWRTQENTFHIEVWRSFSDYLWAYLLDATKDAGI